jgi:hypothetical protein
LCAWRNHRSGGRGLFADGAIAGDVDFEAGGAGLFNHLANGQANQRWDLEALGLIQRDRGLVGWFGLRWLLRIGCCCGDAGL